MTSITNQISNVSILRRPPQRSIGRNYIANRLRSLVGAAGAPESLWAAAA